MVELEDGTEAVPPWRSHNYLDDTAVVPPASCKSSVCSFQLRPLKRKRSLMPSCSTAKSRGLVKNAPRAFDQSISFRELSRLGSDESELAFLIGAGSEMIAASPSGVM